ncbi:hypothetical protein FHR92_003975 [Fontibacillus solani]|uniref:Uncharacterized protein n=1 Tax=Fontibacillus solani TaxID=1572857 RepID=A0A7W3SWL7_9BACL|nr:hypothetical protein [Fontibacillus solani]MBA9087490.1 hypothetical protein [Fontibacillus solani]
MNESRNPKYNASGYPDPTAYQAMKPVIREEAELDIKVHRLIRMLKTIIEWAGFELIGRIQIKDKRTGKEFK